LSPDNFGMTTSVGHRLPPPGPNFRTWWCHPGRGIRVRGRVGSCAMPTVRSMQSSQTSKAYKHASGREAGGVSFPEGRMRGTADRPVLPTCLAGAGNDRRQTEGRGRGGTRSSATPPPPSAPTQHPDICRAGAWPGGRLGNLGGGPAAARGLYHSVFSSSDGVAGPSPGGGGGGRVKW